MERRAGSVFDDDVGLIAIDLRIQPEAFREELDKIKQIVDEIAENLHRLAANLRPASLDHLGLLPALSQHVETISK